MIELELLHPDLPELIDVLLARQGWSWQTIADGKARLNGEPVSLDDLQWFLLQSDPVLWAETHLVEKPEAGGGFWRFFDYQKPSLRWRGHVVHQDGAEVGKSREIVALALWGCLAEGRGSTLVGSARDGDLDEIWEEIQLQKSFNPFIASAVMSETTKPYRRITFRDGFKLMFRPAGHDGQAFRGIHVRARLLHDEAAKVVNPTSWSEFWRSAMPGAEIRIYSVPTGDQLCVFQRLANEAIPAEKIVPATSPATVIEGVLSGSKLPEATRTLSRELGGRVFVRFHWPKTIMPAPFWSDERRDEFIQLFGGVDSPGYQHNVLGVPGDPEYSVFPSRLLDPSVRNLPDYRSLSLRWDSQGSKVDVLCERIHPAYEPGQTTAADSDTSEADADALRPMLTVYRETVDVEGFPHWQPTEREALFRRLITTTLIPLGGFLTAGVDVGSSSTTEILVEATDVSGREVLTLRVSLHGFDWAAQRDFLRCLDNFLTVHGGWGMDATGVGKVLVDLLQAGGDSLAERISGFVFNHAVPAVNPDTGEVLTDPQTGQAQTVIWKEQATQLLERGLVNRNKWLPCDPQLLFLLQNHTYSESGGRRAYSKVNDHLVDGWRCCALRRLMCSYGAGLYSAPLSGIVIPRNNRIDSMGIY